MKKAVLICMLTALTGCYRVRTSDGGGQTQAVPERVYAEKDILLPPGYEIRLVASGLTFPSAGACDENGRVYVVEAGYSYGEEWTRPRLLRIEDNGKFEVVAAGSDGGPWTGVVCHNGAFYIAEGGQHTGGKLLRVSGDGSFQALADSLPGFGDHHINGPVIAGDYLYFGVGTATNSGVVGEDNYRFGWPDYTGNRPLSGTTEFTPPGADGPRPLLRRYPGEVPEPVAVLGVHASVAGLAESSSDKFGYKGELFVAEFGDMAPQVGKVLAPVGFKVSRIHPETGIIRDFAVNKGKRNGPASRLKSGGLERPVSVFFDPEGKAMYVVDFGIMKMSKDKTDPVKKTGALWKITRKN